MIPTDQRSALKTARIDAKTHKFLRLSVFHRVSANGENMPRAQRQRSQDACSATYYRPIRRGVQRSRASFARPLASCLLVVATHAHERREKQPEETARPAGRQTSRAAARRPRGRPRSIHHARCGRCELSDHSECPITALPSTNLPNRD